MSRIALFDAGNPPNAYLLSPMTSDMWGKYQRNAVRYLRATEATEAIPTLEYLPFSCEIVFAQNQVGDMVPTNKHVLMLRVPVEVFVEIETQQGDWPNRIGEQIPKVAHALGRVGCHIWRVIAEVELDAENKPVEILEGDERERYVNRILRKRVVA